MKFRDPIKEKREKFKKLELGDEVEVQFPIMNKKYWFKGKIVGREVGKENLKEGKEAVGYIEVEIPVDDKVKETWRDWKNRFKTRDNTITIRIEAYNAIYGYTKIRKIEKPQSRSEEQPQFGGATMPPDATRVYIPPEEKVSKSPTRKKMMETLGVKPSPYKKGVPQKKPPKEKEKGKKEKVPKKRKKVPKKRKKPRAVKLSPEIKALGPRELLDRITLDYGLRGKYKGKNWIGGARGLNYGEQVAMVQLLYNKLIEAGVLKGPTIRVDGRYGDETKAAIMRMQKAAGVTVDGYFGVDTKTGVYGLLGLTPGKKVEEGEGLPGVGEGRGAEEGAEEEEKAPEEVVRGLTLDRELEKPLGYGSTKELMGENFFVETDTGRLSASELVKRNITDIDKNWDVDKHTAKKIAGRENWETTTLTRKNIGVFSWANTKKTLFPYLAATGQVFEFKTREALQLENGKRIPAGKVIRGRITNYDEKSGEFTVEVIAIQDEFSKGMEEGAAQTQTTEKPSTGSSNKRKLE